MVARVDVLPRGNVAGSRWPHRADVPKIGMGLPSDGARLITTAGGMPATNSFRDLDVWRESMLLVEDVYRLSRTFPADERFGLTSQVRRATVRKSSRFAVCSPSP